MKVEVEVVKMAEDILGDFPLIINEKLWFLKIFAFLTAIPNGMLRDTGKKGVP